MHLLSDILYLITRYVIGYRRTVVRDNLKQCFPQWTEQQLSHCEKAFYHHLCDLLVEGAYNLLFATPTWLRKHYRIVGRELIDRYYENGKSVILVSAHYGNWEYMVTSLNMQFLHHGIGVGKPLNDKLTASFITRQRTRFGTQVVDQTDVRQHVAFYEQHNVPYVLMMLADQSPSNPHRSYWTTFLGRDTAFLYGPEYFARKYDYPVIYYHVQRVRRGYYEITFTPLCEKPNDVPQYSIAEAYVRRLEKDILSAPENWLWSHRRWKLTRTGRLRKDGTLKIINP